MNADIDLFPHQRNAVARIIYYRTALLAHEVGAGKTAEMLTAGMYLKQMGIINKPMFVVPNHLTEQWAKEILTFYPNANVLVTEKKDFEKSRRQEFVAKIATGDYDAIIIGMSQFERISLTLERQQEMIEREIDELTITIEQMKKENAERWTIKQIEAFRQKLMIRLSKLNNDEKRDKVIYFEDTGVDFLFIDEAHNYKNLFAYSKMKNVAGVSNSNSQRASDMLAKVRYIQEMHYGKNVVFATGTPISNSMSELYTMQRYLQPNVLEEKGLMLFDNWASTFGQVVSSLEITPEGGGYRMRNRFSKFHNLPELLNMFYEIADIQTAEMLDLPVPDLETGKVQTIVTEATDFQQQMMDEFVQRAEAIRAKEVSPDTDNMLKLTGEAKLMAIDPRLINPAIQRDPSSKLCICTSKVFEIWKKTQDKSSAQIIFSDSGTPKSGVFNVYDEIKAQLIEKGVPAEQIAFVHDAKTDKQRDELFEKVRHGVVRVILGSTQKLGTGTNIQNKLIAAHHIDCPWKPSDLTQREGRILRRGNENSIVSIFRYVTKGTFDSYLWQIQEQKLTYITQVMTGNNINRSMDDIDDKILTAAEVKAVATNNPMLQEKMSIDNEVARLQMIRMRWSNDRSRLMDELDSFPVKIEKLKKSITAMKEDNEKIMEHPQSEFQMLIHNQCVKGYTEAFEQMNRLESLLTVDKPEVEVGQYRGLTVKLRKGFDHSEGIFSNTQLIIEGKESYVAYFEVQNGTGNIAKLVNLAKSIEKNLNQQIQQLELVEKQFEEAKHISQQDFPEQEKLDELMKKQKEINMQIEFGQTDNVIEKAQ
ncbi:SNF2-related protein [uncultured Enterococcus sp.]